MPFKSRAQGLKHILYIYIHTHTYIYIDIYTYTCMYIYIYIILEQNKILHNIIQCNVSYYRII